MSTVIALYDCRSKQAYIYRTNKIREISGASQILSHVYAWMIDAAQDHGITILNTWREDAAKNVPFDKAAFERSGADGTVIYEGGGSLRPGDTSSCPLCGNDRALLQLHPTRLTAIETECSAMSQMLS